MSTKIYVTVIGKRQNVGIGVEHPKTFTSTDKDALIRQSIQARSEMERNGHGPYTIFLGEITQQVEMPVSYELKEIAEQ